MEKGIARTFILLSGFFIGMILHNLIYMLFGFEEALFFFVTIACMVAFPVSIIMNVVAFFRKKEVKDTWKLVFLTPLGFLSISFWNGPIFYIFFLFPLFLLTKPNIMRKQKSNSKK